MGSHRAASIEPAVSGNLKTPMAIRPLRSDALSRPCRGANRGGSVFDRPRRAPASAVSRWSYSGERRRFMKHHRWRGPFPLRQLRRAIRAATSRPDYWLTPAPRITGCSGVAAEARWKLEAPADAVSRISGRVVDGRGATAWQRATGAAGRGWWLTGVPTCELRGAVVAAAVGLRLSPDDVHGE